MWTWLPFIHTSILYFSSPQLFHTRDQFHRGQFVQDPVWGGSVVQAGMREIRSVQFISVTQSCLTLRPHGLQHARPPCPLPTLRVYSNSCPLSRWCHPTTSSSVIPFSSCLQSFPASGSFQWVSSLHQVLKIGVSVSTSVLPMNIQDWFPLGWTGWISLQSKGLSRVFSNTTGQKHQFFGAQSPL